MISTFLPNAPGAPNAMERVVSLTQAGAETAATVAEPAAFASGQQALAGLVMFIAGLGLVPIATVLGRRLYPGRNIFFARWGFFQVLIAVGVGALASVLMGQAIGSLFEVPKGAGLATEFDFFGNKAPLVLLALIQTCLVSLTVVAYAMFVAKRNSPEGLGALGMSASRLPAAFGVGLSSYLLMLPAILGLAMIWPYCLQAMGVTVEPQSMAEAFVALTSNWKWAIAIFAVLLVPFYEELIFRGFLQPLLVQNFGDKGGILLTSLVFASMHEDAAKLPVFGLSLVLGGVMLRTQRLWAVWFVHALHNGVTLGLLMWPSTREQLLGGLIQLF